VSWNIKAWKVPSKDLALGVTRWDWQATDGGLYVGHRVAPLVTHFEGRAGSLDEAKAHAEYAVDAELARRAATVTYDYPPKEAA
jgi:hypothetical protein